MQACFTIPPMDYVSLIKAEISGFTRYASRHPKVSLHKGGWVNYQENPEIWEKIPQARGDDFLGT